MLFRSISYALRVSYKELNLTTKKEDCNAASLPVFTVNVKSNFFLRNPNTCHNSIPQGILFIIRVFLKSASSN